MLYHLDYKSVFTQQPQVVSYLKVLNVLKCLISNCHIYSCKQHIHL